MACHCGTGAAGVGVVLEGGSPCSPSPLFSLPPSSPEDAGDFEATGSETSLGVVGLGFSSLSGFSSTSLPFVLGFAESLGDITAVRRR